MNKQEELINVEYEIKKLQQRQKQLEHEAQQEFLDNIKDKSLALQIFLKRCKDSYDLAIKSEVESSQRMDFGPISGSLGLERWDVRKLDIYTYPIIEQIFKELYQEEHILTAPNSMYCVLDGEILGYTSQSWFMEKRKDDLKLLTGLVHKFVGVKKDEKKEESPVIKVQCQSHSFDIDVNNVEPTIKTLREFVGKYKIAHLYSAGVYETKNHFYKTETKRLDINGVFYNQ